MNRRTFITAIAVWLGTAPHAAAAQSGGPPRVGFLGNGRPSSNSRQLEAFRRGIHELGWVEGQTVLLEYRWADGSPDRLPALAPELVAAKVDVLVVSGTPAIRAAQAATRTVPSSSSFWSTRSRWGSCRASPVPAVT